MAKSSASDPTFTGDERMVVLHGKEAFLRSELFRTLREAVKKKHEPIDVLRFDGEKTESAEVLDELRSVGLMSQHKVVVVEDAEKFITNYRGPLERYAEQPEETAVLVLRTETWRGGKLEKMVEKIGGVIKCEPLTERTAGSWVQNRAKRVYECTVSARAASLLVARMDTDMGRLDSELAKLAVAVPPGGTIDEKLIESLSGQAGDEKVWEIHTALLSGDAREALVRLHELIDLGGVAPERIAWYLSDLAQKLYYGAVLAAKGQNLAGYCKTSRIWGDAQRPFIAAAKKLKPIGAAALLGQIVEAIRRSRSGAGDARSLMERYCVMFTARIR